MSYLPPSLYLLANGTIPLTANWPAGAFSATFNSVIVGNAANSIAGGSSSAGNFTITSTTNATKGKITLNPITIDEANSLVGIGISSPSGAILSIAAGTTSLAPLKFTAGTNLTTAAAGSVEWDGTRMYLTQTSGPTRKTVAFLDDITGGGGISVVNGTLNRITVANPTTTPTIDIASNYAGQSSIITLGPVTTGTWNASIISPTYGGTGINNGSNTLTLSGAALTLTMSGTTNVTLPTSGTLATTAQVNTKVTKGGDSGAFSVGTTSANTLTFITNNTSAIQIDSSQQIGIGTTPSTGIKFYLIADNPSQSAFYIASGDGNTRFAVIADGTVTVGHPPVGLSVDSTGIVTVKNLSGGGTKMVIVDNAGVLSTATYTPYTFSTGLTNTSGTITANLSTGVSGGQSVVGGTASGNSLILSSTSNATKGKIIFGTSAYDEANNLLGIGLSSPSGARIQIAAGTTTVAPLKFTSGTNLTSPAAGAMEWDGTRLYISQTSGPTRKTIAYLDDIAGGGSYTFSTGLTDTSGTITANLSTGVSGGQTAIGGTASGNNLTLSSTSNATKGNIIFGTSVYDEANNRLGVNKSSPTSQLDVSSAITSAIFTQAGTLSANNSFPNVGVYRTFTTSSPSFITTGSMIDVNDASLGTADLLTMSKSSVLKARFKFNGLLHSLTGAYFEQGPSMGSFALEIATNTASGLSILSNSGNGIDVSTMGTSATGINVNSGYKGLIVDSNDTAGDFTSLTSAGLFTQAGILTSTVQFPLSSLYRIYNTNNSGSLAGTVSNVAGTNVVTGSSTTFTSSFAIGDLITIGGETQMVTAISSNTSMITTTWSTAHTSAAYSRDYNNTSALLELNDTTISTGDLLSITKQGSTKFIVKPNGRVGLLTANPLSLLHLDPINTDGIFVEMGTDVGNYAAKLVTDNTTGLYIQTGTAGRIGDAVNIITPVAGSYGIKINSGGFGISADTNDVAGEFMSSTIAGSFSQTGQLQANNTNPIFNIYRSINPVGSYQSGTVSNSASGTTVTGSGTSFTTVFSNGDTIVINGEAQTISSVNSNTSLTTSAWTNANSGRSYAKRYDATAPMLNIVDNTTVTGDLLSLTKQGTVVARFKSSGVFQYIDGNQGAGKILTSDANGNASWQTSSGGTTYTFSTGLTNTSNTITNNLSTGVSGGQSVVGGTASGNNLTLSSTANATKGKIIFGTSAYDEANNLLGIGVSSPSGARIQIAAGTTSVAPIMFTSGTNLTSATAGAMEWDGTRLYISQTSGPTRKTIAYLDDIGSSLTFSTGLTNTSGTITANLSTGVSGGQTAIGGTASGNNLTLSSTSNATKGKIIFGSVSAYDEVNDRIGAGTTTPSSRLEVQTNALGTSQTTTSGLALVNTTAAANGAQQISPALRFTSNGWGTTLGSSQACDFIIYNSPLQTNAPIGTLLFRAQINGGGFSDIGAFYSNGNVNFGGTGFTAAARFLLVSNITGTNILTPSVNQIFGLLNQSTTDNTFSQIGFYATNTSSSTTIFGAISGVATVHTAGSESMDIAFTTKSAGTLAERMRIFANGTLQIAGLAGSGSRLVYADSSGNLSAATDNKVTKGGDAGAFSVGTTNSNALTFITNNSQAMQITSAQRVYIGPVISPTAKFSVQADVLSPAQAAIQIFDSIGSSRFLVHGDGTVHVGRQDMSLQVEPSSGAVTILNLAGGGNRTVTVDNNGLISATSSPSSYTFSTGLTNTSGTITANLSTGVSGGQTAIGGTASGNNLTLSSTSNATKGKIIFGSASAYDEVNDRIGAGTTSPTSRVEVRTDSLGTSQTTTSGLALVNTTAAANGAQQISPALRFSSNGWGTTASTSQTIDFMMYNVPIQTSVPIGTLLLRSQVNGGGFSDIGAFYSNGNINFGGTGFTQAARFLLLSNQSGTTITTPNFSQMIGMINQSTTDGTFSSFNFFATNTSSSTTVFGGITGIATVHAAGTEAMDIAFTTKSAGTLAERMRLIANGNLGINLTNPGSKIEVRTDALGTTQTTSSGITLSNSTAAANGAQQISPALRFSSNGWGTTASTSQSIAWHVYSTTTQGTTPTGQLIFESDVNGGGFGRTIYMYSSGNMSIGGGGLGTNAKLSILGTTTNTTLSSPNSSQTLSLENTDTTNNNFFTIAFYGTSNTRKIYGSINSIFTNHTNGTEAMDMAFWTMNAGTYGERVRLFSTGNMAIGNTTDAARLSVVGANNTTANSGQLLVHNTGDGSNYTEAAILFKAGLNSNSDGAIGGRIYMKWDGGTTGDNRTTIATQNSGGTWLDTLSIIRDCVIIGGTTPQNAANKRVLSIINGTPPSGAQTDGIQIYSKDSSAGSANATLGLETEQAVQTAVSTGSTHKLRVWVNGTEYALLMTTDLS